MGYYKEKENAIKTMTEYHYLIEKDNGKVKITFDTFDEMLKVARNYEKQGIEYDCYNIKKKPVFLEKYQLEEK